MMYHFFQTGMFPKIKVNIVKTNQEYSIVLPFLFIKQTNKIILQIKLSERLKIFKGFRSISYFFTPLLDTFF